MKCPECNTYLRAGAKSCQCGWSQSKGEKSARCDDCGNEYPFPSRAADVPFGHQRIVGRSKSGGHICQSCYERGESFDYRDKAFADFHEKHKGDEWGSLIGATYQLKGAPREDFRDVIDILKSLSRKYGGTFGVLPYDKTEREPA